MRRLLIALVIISLFIVPVLASTETFNAISDNSDGRLYRAGVDEPYYTIYNGAGTGADLNSAGDWGSVGIMGGSVSPNEATLIRFGFCANPGC
jgi:hypothetical protein